MIQQAVMHAQASGGPEVIGSNVLVAIFTEKDSHAALLLRQQGMTRIDAVNFIVHGIRKTDRSDG